MPPPLSAASPWRARAPGLPTGVAPSHLLRRPPPCRAQVTDDVALVPSKRMRNKIAGFVTHLMRRIERGDNVRGISLKLQEEERERRLDFVPEVSAVQTDSIPVDADTAEMLKAVGLGSLPGVKVQAADRGDGAVPGYAGGGGGGGGGGRERRPRAPAGGN